MFKGSDAEIPPETICNSTGWGLTSGAGLFLPNALQWAKIPQHSREQCKEIFPGYISDGMICAGGEGHATFNVSSLFKLLDSKQSFINQLGYKHIKNTVNSS